MAIRKKVAMGGIILLGLVAFLIWSLNLSARKSRFPVTELGCQRPSVAGSAGN